MKVPEVSENEVHKFLRGISTMLERLDLIQPFAFSDPPGEEQVWGMHNQLAVCFPNLSLKERRLVFDVYLDAINANHLKTHKTRLRKKYGIENFAYLVKLFQRNYAASKKRLEKSQLRLKLSVFQEALLDGFAKIDPPNI